MPRLILSLLFSTVIAGCATTAPPAPPPEPVRIEAVTKEEAPQPLPPAVTKPAQPTSVPPGVIESRAFYPQTGATIWDLADGSRVIFKRTTTVPRRVLALASAPGGLVAIPGRLAVGALVAGQRLSVALTEQHAPVEVGVWLRTHETWLVGEAQVEALPGLVPAFEEAMRARVNLPAVDPEVFFTQQRVALAAGAQLAEVLDPVLSAEAVEALGVQSADPHRFTLVLVGDTAPDAIEQHVIVPWEALRPMRRVVLTESSSDHDLPGEVRWDVQRTTRAPLFTVAFRGETEAGYEALAALDVLDQLLRASVRGEGSEESTSVVTELDARTGHALLRVDGTGEGLEDLLEYAERLRSEGPTPAQLVDARTDALTMHRFLMDSNLGWASWLLRVGRPDDDTREILAHEQRIRGVSARRIQDLARDLFDPGHAAIVTVGDQETETP